MARLLLQEEASGSPTVGAQQRLVLPAQTTTPPFDLNALLNFVFMIAILSMVIQLVPKLTGG